MVVQIRRSETNLVNESDVSTDVRYVSSVELGSTEMKLKRGVLKLGYFGKHLNYDAKDWN